MIEAKFYQKESVTYGFEISGHAGYKEAGRDIVCASVSSAVYLTVNGITDVICCRAYVKVDDSGVIRFILLDRGNKSALDMIRSLELHLSSLAEDYPKNLTVIFTTEV